MWLGFLVLACLSGLALLAGLAIALRAGWSGRAEIFVGASLVTHALITFPTLALGWSGLLYRSVLGLTCALVSIAVLGLCFVGRDRRAFARELAGTVRSLMRLPVDAFLAAARPPSMALLGVLCIAGTIAWTGWVSYLAPSSSWDGTWYHETIVGFALQNHGFELMKLPLQLTYVNSFPKVCEMMNLWFVAFGDRTLIEAVNTAMAPTMVLALYCIVRRYTDQKSAMGWAAVLLLIPAVVLQMRSTYIDLHVASLTVAAMHFVTRPRLRIRDAWMGALCLALLLGTKYHAWIWVPFLGCVLAGRLLAGYWRTRRAAAWGTIAGAVALIALVAAPVHVRNWVHFKNPFYPIAVESARFGIHWGGYQHVDDIRRPIGEVLADGYTVHVPGHDFCDTKEHSYGMAIPWVVLPVAMVALGAALLLAMRGLARLAGRDHTAENLLLTVLPALATIPLSPAIWLGRYNIHVAAGLIIAAAWGVSRSSTRRFGEGVLGAALLISIMMLWWAEPGLAGTSYDKVMGAAKLSVAGRAAYDWPMYAVPTRTAQARERELGPGTVVAFADTGPFPSVLWNDHFSNRLVYVPFTDPAAYRRSLIEAGAKWAVAVPGTGEHAALRAATDEWEEVGLMTTTDSWTAFRRRS
jgi:hypothetical protein